MDFKIDGITKTLDKGYVKIDGALKQIDKIWTKVDGVLKGIYSSFPFELIQGDINAGYGGQLTGFCTQSQLESLTGMNIGVSYNVGDITWLQFAYQGKALYIANRIIRYNVSWNSLNSLGLVDGKTIVMNGKNYICRIMKGGNTYTGTYSNKTGGVRPNEWDNLFVDLLQGKKIVYEEGKDYSDVKNWTICQEHSLNGTYSDYIVLRGYYAFYGWNDNHSSYSSYGWRPVLELIQ